jgi:hypothetical protein
VINGVFITLDELGQMLYMFSNSIDYEIIAQSGMKFEKSFESYSMN